MMKKLRKIIIVTILSLCACIFYIYQNVSKRGVFYFDTHLQLTPMSFISGTGDEETYFVYLYSNEDKYQDINKQVKAFGDKENLYLVNLEDNQDKIENFDWKEFHQENDLEIGIVNDDRQIEYYVGESKEKYLNNETNNVDGKINQYQIIVADKEYLKINDKAKIDHVYASLLTPDIHYNLYNLIREKFVLLDTPMLLEMSSLSIINYYYGIDGISGFVTS